MPASVGLFRRPYPVDRSRRSQLQSATSEQRRDEVRPKQIQPDKRHHRPTGNEQLHSRPMPKEAEGEYQ